MLILVMLSLCMQPPVAVLPKTVHFTPTDTSYNTSQHPHANHNMHVASAANSHQPTIVSHTSKPFGAQS